LLARGISVLLVFAGAIGIATTGDASGLRALGLGAILLLAVTGTTRCGTKASEALSRGVFSRFVPE
jgi:hypothetical protein